MNKNYTITSETYQFIEKTQKRFIKSKKRVQDFVSFISPKLPNEKTTFENDVEKYEYKKNQTVKLNHSTLQSVADCGSWLTFRNYYNIDKTTLHTANFCKKDKLCPACATRRAAKQVKKVYNTISSSEELKKKYWYYIVLPVKHNSSEDYETVFNRAKDGLKKLRFAINESKKKKNSKNFFSKFDGMFYSFEVTKSKNGWNVHINLLCCSDNEIEGIYTYTQKDGKTTSQHKDIMRDWSKYTDNESFMHSINKIDTSSKEDLIKNLLEVFKYALKFQELKNEDLFEVYEKSFGKRLIGAFGSLYNIKLDVELENEDLLDEEFLELVYRFNYSSNTYEEYQREFKKDYTKQKTITKLNRSKLIRDKIPDFVKIFIYDKDKNLQSLQIKRNIRSITDYEIFSYSLYKQKIAPQV